MKRWLSDLALGVRLAIGGGRTSWVRLALTGAGIGVGVAVLLTASSVPTMLSARAERTAAQNGVLAGDTTPSSDVLYVERWVTDFRGQVISGDYVRASGPEAPVPPGASRVPGDGEIVLSPALASLLDSPQGELLRERFPQQRVGVITQQGLNAPHDLRFVAGDASVDEDAKQAVVSYGGAAKERTLDPVLSLLIMVGVVALLFPVLVFVGISTRLAATERDRRLAALRLVGAGAQRVRRIAAGESLLGAVTGLVVGAALFLTARQFVERIKLMGISVFVGDATPSLPLAVLIAVLVPVMAVVTSIIAMRRTVVEPLGVVRRSKPVRRVLWWRTVPVLVGAVALVSQSGALGGTRNDASVPIVVGGILSALLSIPVLLPWVVERAVGRLRGGAPSWQLAIRRLQLESGTAARVVGGVAVVLAGGIALQSVLASAETRIVDRPAAQTDPSRIMVSLNDATSEATEQAVGLLERSGAVDRVHPLWSVQLKSGEDDYHYATLADCDGLKTQVGLPACRDGDVFYVHDPNSPPEPGQEDIRPGTEVILSEGYREQERLGPRWTVPDYTEIARPRNPWQFASEGLMITPGALANLDVPRRNATILVQVDPSHPDVAEHVRNAVAPLTWRTYLYYYGETDVSERIAQFESIRQGLLAGSLLTLLLAGASLLVLALEQVRERRRPLAVLAASGVPRGALSRSLLWQNAVPLLLALVVAIAIGSGLAVLLLRIIAQPIVLDWPGMAVLSAAAALLVVAVTALTLPSLRRATGALGLRSE
ncbi:ABC-type lipoprotein release transport system permease subunit [Saccharothrix tamanrassetensis]|uniref:ABC-type lipoprotein release transport system permease subunit n=1 Tax=Saccharothrix tamanrassetensis TaxID=1051531 RepID=A0A841CE76_9PSEU|nr:FtsX-like permease family protein [Saccharothrix tamanrassetensis]MBB5954664.1 ABC-type lipoprotein release transport system permease subunit [Saccharothrix tamanrassetensis]